ncbi:ferrous iron transport protein B [Candidatus Lariskella endosymbiont of Epinotia ramella]|uniref:ferrous iron transport protein B n=1 Tax=Candidatus Lariskella endosymbiont of Epinotia ramella TaxID=3066224 RepID=UPI0030D62D45
MSDSVSALLVGAPNSGKSTLFNLLTGKSEKTGNWSGVTVQEHHGHFIIDNDIINLVDLPGVSSISIVSNQANQDERVAIDALLAKIESSNFYKVEQDKETNQKNIVINVVDSSNMRYSLYLTMQLIEMGMCHVLALNMADLVSNYNLLDADKLSKLLGVPTVKISAKQDNGILNLCALIAKKSGVVAGSDNIYSIKNYDKNLVALVNAVSSSISYENIGYSKHWVALKLVEEGYGVIEKLGINLTCDFSAEHLDSIVVSYFSGITAASSDLKSLISDSRYKCVDAILEQVMAKTEENEKPQFMQKLDAILLNRFCGIVIFAFVMYFIFSFSILFGGAFQSFFQSIAEIIFVHGTSKVLHMLDAPDETILLLAYGIGSGIVVVASFVPLIAALYFIFSALEEFGYFARAALLMNRLMNKVGLSGHAFIPLILGFGCNVPAIVATRSLSAREQRIVSIMMMPFMSCSARLSVFVLFYMTFFSSSGPIIILLLYFIGLITGLITAHITSKMIKNTPDVHFLMILPNYQLPSMRSLLDKTYMRAKDFVFGAGKLIVLICFVLNLLNIFTLRGEKVSSCMQNIEKGEEKRCDSILIASSKIIAPVFEPMGLARENWQATVGVITGLLAKEVVVGTLNSLYSSSQNVISDESRNFLELFHDAFTDTIENIKGAFASAFSIFKFDYDYNSRSQEFLNEMSVENSTIKKIREAFGSKATAFAYMLFILLYFPCVSVFAVIANEIGLKWAILSSVWSTAIAYIIAVSFYQAAMLFG